MITCQETKKNFTQTGGRNRQPSSLAPQLKSSAHRRHKHPRCRVSPRSPLHRHSVFFFFFFTRAASPGKQLSLHNANSVLSFFLVYDWRRRGFLLLYLNEHKGRKEIGKIFTQLQTLKAEGGGSHTLWRGKGA